MSAILVFKLNFSSFLCIFSRVFGVSELLVCNWECSLDLRFGWNIRGHHSQQGGFLKLYNGAQFTIELES